MPNRRDRFARRVAGKLRSIANRAGRRFLKAGNAGAEGHIGWLDYEQTVYRTLEYQYWENQANVIPIGSYYEFGLFKGAAFSRCYRTLKTLARDVGLRDVRELGVRMY